MSMMKVRINTLKKFNIRENQSGRKYGKLTIVEYIGSVPHLSGKKGIRQYYKVKCECGTVFTLYLGGIKKGNGCKNCYSHVKRGKNHPSWTGYKDVPGSFITYIKHCALSRSLDFNVDLKYIANLYEKQEGKCALTDLPLKFSTTYDCRDRTASLDRIDSDKGYVRGNVRWTHYIVNWFKNTLSDEQLYSMCSLIYNKMKSRGIKHVELDNVRASIHVYEKWVSPKRSRITKR